MAAVALAISLAACTGSDATVGVGEPATLSEILSDGAHAHDLAVDEDDPEGLWLGIHGGLYRSEDGGRRWRLGGLKGQDAMNVADAGAGPLWVAGHDVLERSTDGGRSFEAAAGEGLPNRDLHGFTTRPGHANELIAAAAGRGLYRSRDGGASFGLLSEQVGSSVLGLSMSENGVLYATDPRRGLLVRREAGAPFVTPIATAGLVAVAVHPARPRLVMAGGDPGILVSDDGGRSWERTFSAAGVAALAVAPSDPSRAYALGQNAALYRSDDAGRTWSPVRPDAS